MKRPIQVGDLGKFNGRIVVVLEVQKLFLKIMKIKTGRKHKIHPNSKKLTFPADYFNNRFQNRQECAEYLRYDFSIILCFFFNLVFCAVKEKRNSSMHNLKKEEKKEYLMFKNRN